MLIFDCQYTYGEAHNEKRYWGHSNHISAVELARRSQVKQLAIFYPEPNYSDADIEEAHYYTHLHLEQLKAEATLAPQYPEELLIAYDGLAIEA